MGLVIIRETDRVLCELRTEAEQRVDYLSVFPFMRQGYLAFSGITTGNNHLAF
jgi:hypothetical protein